MSTEFAATDEPSRTLLGALCDISPENPFYTPAYVEARRALGFSAWAFTLRDQEQLVAGCTGFARAGSLGATLLVPSVPALPESSPFWEGLADVCRRARFVRVELDSLGAAPGRLPPLPCEARRRARREYVLDLRSPEPSGELSANHARNVRRGRKAGLQLSRTRQSEACEAHRQLIDSSLLRRRGRGESVPGGLATGLAEAFVRSGAGEIFQARLGDAVVSSVLVLMASLSAYYQSAGTSQEGRACGASHWLICEVAERLRAEGRDSFNLGGAGAGEEGLARFKSGFGTAPRELDAVELDLRGAFRKAAGSLARSFRRGR